MPSRAASTFAVLCLFLLTIAGIGAGWWWWKTHAGAADATPGANERPPGAEPSGKGAASAAPMSAAGGAGRGGRVSGPASVLAATAGPEELRLVRQAIGTVTSLATVTIRSQIAGRLDQVLYREGQKVAQGDQLAHIDDRPYRLSQAQYLAQQQRDQALLASAEQDLARYRTLVAQDSLARQQLDTQLSLVSQLHSTVATDQALIDAALLNQEYCRIVAPVSGRLGLRLVDTGNYVTPGDSTGLVTITQLRPISVVFTLPETFLDQVLAKVHAGTLLPVEALDHDGATRLAAGTVATIDNAIDAATGTIKLRAEFANGDERLYPNQFVNVLLELERRQVAIAVPTVAVQRGPKGPFAWLVQDGKATLRLLRLGSATNEQVEVLEGLAAGDQVVIDGVDRLREGASVMVASDRSPARNEPAPGGGKRPAGAADGATPPPGAKDARSDASPPAGQGEARDGTPRRRRRAADGTPGGGDAPKTKPASGGE